MQSLHFSLALLSPPSYSLFSVACPFARSRAANRRPISFARSGGGFGESSDAGEVVSGVVEDLLRREENRTLLEGIEAAERRVDRAREALASIDHQEASLLRARERVVQLERQQLEISESQKELHEARNMLQEAQHSLSSSIEQNEVSSNSCGAEDASNERMESIKAVLVSSIVGTLAYLPVSFIRTTEFPQLALQWAAVFISSGLFGVTFRYAIRRDLDSLQLKTGVVAAFGIVKGFASLDGGKPLETSTTSFLSHAIDGGVSISQNIVVFLFSAIALDYCFKVGLLSPFPIRK